MHVYVLHFMRNSSCTAASVELGSLWKEFFKDSSRWSDIRHTKTDLVYPDSQCKLCKGSHWICNGDIPCWVKEELHRRSILSPCMKFKEIRREEVKLCDKDEYKLQECSTGYIAMLKACGNQKNLERANRIHGDILKRGSLEKDTSLGNTLVSVYAKCGELTKAHQTFDQLWVRDAISWNALISGYTQGGHYAGALNCFEQMRWEGLSASSVTYICVLKVCGSIREIERGENIHAEIVREGFLKKYIAVGNALVDMYAKCGALIKAQEVFNELQVRNIVSWNALITGYANHGSGEQVLKYFKKLQHEGFFPNKVTFLCVLKACGSIGVAEIGKEAHAEIVRNRSLEKDALVGTALVDMYAKCGALLQAVEVFYTLPVRDRVSWNAIISGYVQHGHAKEALSCFQHMQQDGVSPDVVTFICILKSCGTIGALDRGKEIHVEIVKQKLQDNVLIVTALVDMYAKCDALVQAQEVFDQLRPRSTVCWNSLIAGYACWGHVEEALNCFEQMQKDGILPDTVTFLSLLKACGSKRALDRGKEIHAKIIKEGKLGEEILVTNAIVDMYAKCGALDKAQEVFDELGVQTIVSWNALIAGYAQQGPGEKAVNCYERMRNKGFSPSALTFASILKACGSMGAIGKGKEIHEDIMKQELQTDVLVGNALVDMYAKCGVPIKAQEVFDELPVRDVVAWTALISGYSQIGQDETVISLFNTMIDKGINPDPITCTIVLNACSRSGLLDKGEMYYEAMNSSYGIAPNLDHCTCMVDMLGRAGQFGKIESIIDEMPTLEYLPLWTTLLGACHKWGNVELGSMAFKHVVQLDEKHCSAYVLMSNLYVNANMQDEAQTVEALRVKNEAWEDSAYL